MRVKNWPLNTNEIWYPSPKVSRILDYMHWITGSIFISDTRCSLAHEAGTYPRTMTSLVSSCETQGLQSQSIRNLAQSLWRNRRVAPMRSRSFILLGPYWTADDSSLVKNSLWNTGGASLKYLDANLTGKKIEHLPCASSVDLSSVWVIDFPLILDVLKVMKAFPGSIIKVQY